MSLVDTQDSENSRTQRVTVGRLILACVLALAIGCCLVVAGLVIHAILLLALMATKVSGGPGAPGIIGFSLSLIAIPAPLLVLGVLHGRRGEAWRVAPLAIATLPLVLMMLGATSPRHALFVPGAALLGWMASAFSRRRRRVLRLLAATLAVMVLSAAALVLGAADRNWFVAQASARAREFGVRTRAVPDVAIMDFKPVMAPGGIYATFILNDDAMRPSGPWEQYWFWLDSRDCRRRKGDKAYLYRRYSDVVFFDVRNTAEAKELARKSGVPDRFLTGLRTDAWVGFSNGSVAGTWQKPHVEVSTSGVKIEVGERPH